MKNTKRALFSIVFLVVLFAFTYNVKVSANEFIVPDGNFVVSHKRTELAPGVLENEVIYNNKAGTNPVAGFLVDIDLNNPNTGVMAATTNYNETGVETVMNMAKSAEQVTGRKVVAGINADLNWDGTGISNGPMIVDGKIIHDEPAPFVGIKKDGTGIIGTEQEYVSVKGQLQHAVTARMGWLVKDGVVVNGDPTIHPRTAVGIKADGSMFFYVVEGRAEPRSKGISLFDLATIMKNHGAVQAINMDGGGSTTYISRRPGNDNLEVTALLSDGRERPSISSLLIYTEVGDGEFKKANVSSDGDAFTPRSEVKFTARGLDNVGGSAPLPSDLLWEVEDPNFGDIDQSGLFTSSGEIGEVIVNLKDSSGLTVGSHTISILVPDEIEFRSNNYSLGFNESTDFGMRLLNNKRELKYKDGDVIWSPSFLDDDKNYYPDVDEILGSFNNNIFTSSNADSVDGKVLVTVADNPSINFEFDLSIGQKPRVIFDFEDDSINHLWGASTAEKGEKADVQVVNRDDGEPVRFGDKSLRLDFDFRENYARPGGTYVTIDSSIEDYGYSLTLPGVPKSLGMWIYGTEEVQGLWLRSGIGVQGTTSWKAFNLVDEKTGIDWLGWKFVEMDLSNEIPDFKILHNQFVRLMLTSNSFGGDSSKKPYGSLYVDNITAMYGYNPEDTSSPEVHDIKLLENGNEIILNNNQNIDFNRFTIESTFSDYSNEFMTDMNYDDINIFVDGKNYKDTEFYDVSETDKTVRLQNVYLDDGIHEIKVEVYDKAGNQGSLIRFINVKTGLKPLLFFEFDEHVLLGREFNFSLKSNDIDKITSLTLSLNISAELSDFEIEFLNGFEGEVEYLNSIKMLNIKLTKTGTSTTNEIFRFKSFIDNKLLQGTNVRLSMQSSNYTFDGEKETYNSFSFRNIVKQVEAPLDIQYDFITINDESHIAILDADGKPVEGADLFRIQGDSEIYLGTSDINGLVITDHFRDLVQSFVLFAKKGEDISFEKKGQSLNSYGEDSGLPFGILLNGVDNPYENKNITWLSNSFASSEEVQVRFAIKGIFNPNNPLSFNIQNGSSKRFSLLGSTDINNNFIINVNNVIISNLLPGTEYEYQVGNGDVWSETKEFKTLNKFEEVDFFILGDIQSSIYDNIYKNLNSVGNFKNDYDFGIQVGDFIDNASRFDHWNGVLESISQSNISNVDMIKTLGNHEFYGDEQGNLAKAIFGLEENKDFYSVEYGSVYVAVFSYDAFRESMIEKLEWIEQDAKKSNAKWKFLITHQPPYYTNPQGGNELANELIPSYAERAGFDFVISGHDHAYARTAPMKDGEFDVNGTRYIIAGSFGEKGYPFSPGNIDFEVVESEEKHIYLSVQATENKISFKVISAITNAQIDEFIVTKNDYNHEHIYILEGDRLVCYECNHSRPLEGYIGFLRNEENDIMYRTINGEFHVGLLTLGSNVYFFDENGFAYIGEHIIWDLNAVFDSNGLLINGGTGFTRYFDNKLFYFDKFVKFRRGWQEIDNELYYIDRWTYEVRTGIANVPHEDGEYYEQTFDTDGKLLEGRFIFNEKGTRYFYGGIYKGWKEIDGYVYYFSYGDGYTRSGETVIWNHKGLYKFNEYGQLLKGGFVETNGKKRYYFGSQEDLENYVTGFYEIEDDIYYFDENGYLLIGEFLVNGLILKSDKNGKIFFN